MTETKKLYVKTYGCQMNVYDSERMTDAMAADGYVAVDTPEDADLVILNTCHIREKAAEKVYSELGRLRPLAEAKKKAGGQMVVGVAGCVAQAEGAEIVKRAPLVDVVVGPQAYHRLPALARDARSGAKQIETEFPAEDKFDHIPAPKGRRAPAAFLTVQEGCDKFCAFCVVPYTRGAEVSRPVEKLVAEARSMVANGVVEITLLGQNVNAYHGVGPDGSEWGLGRLIRALSEIEGLQRLRYTTSHPNDMDAELISAHGDVPELMPYLHLPVQAGSDRVLKAMNRKHTRDDYHRLIERIRNAQPDLALSGDFIVGFPGETDADFQETMSLVRDIGYAQAFSFKYSPRPGTPAAEGAQVPEEAKAARLAELQDLLSAQQIAFNQSCIGQTLPVLLEKPGKEAGQLVGRSPFLQPTHVQASAEQVGRIVAAEIVGATKNSLAGRLVA
ncbi:MAG: tRNA (N6-isopentenyl adenosine(37)-C2)-methylthiotransferase MiaB [Pseudomonadota bacterium]